MHQPDGCLGSVPPDEHAAADPVHRGRGDICYSHLPVPGIFQHHGYFELAADFYYPAGDPDRIFNELADEGRTYSDKGAVSF